MSFCTWVRSSVSAQPLPAPSAGAPGWGACGWGKAPPGVIWTRAVAMYSAGRRKFHNRPGMSTSAKTSRKTRSRRRLLRRVAASPSRSGVTSSSR